MKGFLFLPTSVNRTLLVSVATKIVDSESPRLI